MGKKEGGRNQSLDYSLQGVDCYIAYFIATGIAEAGVELNLRLGTSYQVEQIRFSNGEQLLMDINPVNFLSQQSFLVFPNPVNSRDQLNIYTKDFQDKEVELRIYNSSGQQVMKYKLVTDRGSCLSTA